MTSLASLRKLAFVSVCCACAIVRAAMAQPPHESDTHPRASLQHSASLVLLSQPNELFRPRLSKIASILVEQCVGCHNAQQTDGGYSMATPLAMTVAGDSKRVPIGSQAVPDAVASTHSTEADYGEIFRRIVSHDAADRMPKDATPLDWDSVESVREWLATGARVDGDMDAPIESFVPWAAPSSPRFVSYPRPHSVGAIAINDAGELAFTSGHTEVLIWKLTPTPKFLYRIPVRGRFISDIAWNENSQSVCVASGEPGRIGFVESIPWNPTLSNSDDANRDGIESPTIENDSQSTPTSQASTASGRLTHWICRDIPLDIALSRDGTRIAIGNADGSVVVADANSNHILWKSPAHAAAVTSVDWSDEGSFVVSSSRDRTAKSFQAEDGQVLNSFVDHERTVASVRTVRRGAVTMDEAGVLRWFPNLNSPGSRAQRDGFAQSTEKLVSSQDLVVVPTRDSLQRYLLRREEIVESKDEEGKEKKKTLFHIDESGRLDLASIEIKECPISLAITHGSQPVIVAGFTDGTVLIWNMDSKAPHRFDNQPFAPSERE
jgi:WD40 repeat protein